MKKIYFIVIALCTVFLSHAQMLTPTVIASSGAFASNANGSLSYTVGEMSMVQTFTGGNNILTQGFQQPNDFVSGLIDLSQEDFGSFVVYPNPATDNLWFGLQFPEKGKISVVMYNELGQKITDAFSSNYDAGKIVEQLNVSTYASGVYFLTVSFQADNGKVRTLSKKFQVIR